MMMEWQHSRSVQKGIFITQNYNIKRILFFEGVQHLDGEVVRRGP